MKIVLVDLSTGGILDAGDKRGEVRAGFSRCFEKAKAKAMPLKEME